MNETKEYLLTKFLPPIRGNEMPQFHYT